MGMEKEGYRDNLERIKETFPNKELLNVKDVSTFTGLYKTTVKKVFKFADNGYISVASLARQMS